MSADSWSGKLNKLGNSFKSFLKEFANTGMIKGFLDVLTGVANGLDLVTSKLGGLGTVAANNISFAPSYGSSYDAVGIKAIPHNARYAKI